MLVLLSLFWIFKLINFRAELKTLTKKNSRKIRTKGRHFKIKTGNKEQRKERMSQKM